jgi:hypothetical protein
MRYGNLLPYRAGRRKLRRRLVQDARRRKVRVYHALLHIGAHVLLHMSRHGFFHVLGYGFLGVLRYIAVAFLGILPQIRGHGLRHMLGHVGLYVLRYNDAPVHG